MTVHFSLQSLVFILAGIAIFVRPKDFHYIIAICLICVGLLGMATF